MEINDEIEEIVEVYIANYLMPQEDGEILAGELPKKQLRLVQAWIELYKDELFANWEIAIRGENPYKIRPL